MRQRALYTIRSDGKIKFGRDWLKLSSVIKLKSNYKKLTRLHDSQLKTKRKTACPVMNVPSIKRHREREEWRKYDEKNRQKRRSEGKLWCRKNKEKISEYKRSVRKQWTEEQRTRARERNTKSRLKTNPTTGLRHTISEYRSGKIGIDELNRRINEAIERTNELDIPDSSNGRKPL